MIKILTLVLIDELIENVDIIKENIICESLNK